MNEHVRDILARFAMATVQNLTTNPNGDNLMTNLPVVQLGDKAKDTVTGYKGTVTCISDYLAGCQVVSLTPKLKKDGTLGDTHHFDIERIKVLKSGAAKVEYRPTGGPANPSELPRVR